MKLGKFFLMSALVGVVAVIGCGDDGGGTAGSGGTTGSGGSAGEGGTGGDPFDPVLCNREACVENETLRGECEDELELCRSVPEGRQDECIGLALATCNAE